MDVHTSNTILELSLRLAWFETTKDIVCTAIICVSIYLIVGEVLNFFTDGIDE